MGEGARSGSIAAELEEERRRNLRHNLEVVRLYARLASSGDPAYWRSYVEFINEAYRAIWKSLEDSKVLEAYPALLRKRRPREPELAQRRD